MNLQELRKSKGFTQEQVARQIDVALATYRNWEKKIYIPKLEKAKRLSEVFGVSVDEILSVAKN